MSRGKLSEELSIKQNSTDSKECTVLTCFRNSKKASGD